jgi:hypothetical protein
MMHRIDRLEERLRRHAPGVDAERRVIGIIAHEKKDAGAQFRRNPSGSKTSRTTSDHRNRFSVVQGLDCDASRVEFGSKF